jgi:antitoxin HicB
VTKQPKKYVVTDGELTLTLEVAEEGGFVVTSPFDPEILTQAETLEEAFEMAHDVVELYKEVRTSDKKKTTQHASRKK